MFNGNANRSIDDSFYRRAAWKKTRAAFIKHREGIDGGLCQMCHLQPGRIVHHRIHLNSDTVNNPVIAYGFDNLEYVCLDCHNEEHGLVPQSNLVRYDFDANGNPVPRT